MRIKKIILKNLFSYHGIQEINFDERTIILAENGFGKTSLLNAIKLGLGEKRFKLDSILNSHANDSECFIEIDFTDFVLKRVWDLKENFEDLTIYLGERLLKDYEAEEFLKEKFPSELIDFIFFDGEVEKDIILLKSQKIKKLFEYAFDLDILSNMIVDTKKVAKKISHNIGNKEVVYFQGLQESESQIVIKIEAKEEAKRLLTKELRVINERIRLNNLKIKNRSKALNKVEYKIEENHLKLSNYIEIFYEINLYQLPLILNKKLFKSIQDNTNQSIELVDKKEFEKSFDLFSQSINSQFSKQDLLEKFYKVFNTDKKILLQYSSKELLKLLTQIKNAIEKRERFLVELDELRQKLLNKDEFQKFEALVSELNDLHESKALMLNNAEEEIENLNIQHKEVHKKLRLEFINKRDKYSSIKTIEELENISKISHQVYDDKLEKSLKAFNQLFKTKIKPFLETHKHIQNITINEKFKLDIFGSKDKLLDITLLSAGQKQILSFILISTILEFKNFINFIFIDTPFGRLSNKNRDFIFNTYYLSFSYLTLLVTSSEYDYLKDKNLDFKEYTIYKDNLGSHLGALNHD